MSDLNTPYYFDGIELIYPFEEYSDTDNAWIRRIYLINQSHYRLSKPRYGDRIPYDLLSSYPDISARDPWLVQTISLGEAPGRVRVTEIYGYVPEVTHSFPSAVNWVKPGISMGESSTPRSDVTSISNTTADATTLNLELTPTFSVGARGRLVFRNPLSIGGTSLGSTICRVTAVNAGSKTARIEDLQPGVGTSLSEISQAYVQALSAGGDPTLYWLLDAGGDREPQSFNVPAVVRRDYFRAKEDPAFPPIDQPYSILTDTGGTTDVLTPTTTPTIEEYAKSIGEIVVGDVPTIGRVMGDIWYRETPYIQLF